MSKFPLSIGSWCCIRQNGDTFELWHVLADRMVASAPVLSDLIEWFSLGGAERCDNKDFV